MTADTNNATRPEGLAPPPLFCLDCGRTNLTPHLDLRMVPWSPYSRREPSEYACESCGGKNLQPKQTMKNTDADAKTDAWTLESLSVNYSGELWSIRCGGACMPEYHITEHTIEQAVTELVKQVTRDAIEDEAREWQNDLALAQQGLGRSVDGEKEGSSHE